ncbi:MAG: NAD(P)H-binding protein [Pyrinomonadaceae bacterium]|nr:NAD(P)H-binding protein [Phycisphaerales bacterium]
MPRPSTHSVLVIGAAGAFGAAITLELLGRGVHVRIFTRDLEKARRRFGNRANADYLTGDAFDNTITAKAMLGCQGIILTLNVPADQQCKRAGELLRMFTQHAKQSPKSAPAASTSSDVGDVEDVGAATDVAPSARADSMFTPAILIPTCLGDDPTAADSLRAVAASLSSRAILLRTGRFYGSTIRNPLVDSIFRSALEWRTIRAPGSLDAQYPWTYAPDAARAAIDLLLLATDAAPATTLAPLTHVDFVPADLAAQRQFLETVGAAAIRLTSPAGPDADPAASQHPPHVGEMPGWKLTLASLTNPHMKQVRAQQHLWTSPPPLNAVTFGGLLPEFAHTPLELAARTTLTSYR